LLHVPTGAINGKEEGKEGRQKKARRRLRVEAQTLKNVTKPGGLGRPAASIEQLRQSWLSNYCGVYATGMFLSLLGRDTSREHAKRLFLLSRANPSYQGASLDDVLVALRSTGIVRTLQWKFFKPFRLQAICDALLDHSDLYGLPTLLYFGIVHKRLGSTAKHFSVITRVERDRLHLLDPLGSRRAKSHNVSILQSQSQPLARVQVVGCNYFVNQRAEAALLLRKI
jgi:hypothetical protein